MAASSVPERLHESILEPSVEHPRVAGDVATLRHRSSAGRRRTRRRDPRLVAHPPEADERPGWAVQHGAPRVGLKVDRLRRAERISHVEEDGESAGRAFDRTERRLVDPVGRTCRKANSRRRRRSPGGRRCRDPPPRAARRAPGALAGNGPCAAPCGPSGFAPRATLVRSGQARAGPGPPRQDRTPGRDRRSELGDRRIGGDESL